eukprot:g14048.t1
MTLSCPPLPHPLATSSAPSPKHPHPFGNVVTRNVRSIPVPSIKRLETLDTAKSAGPDNILAIVLKTCAPELAAPLAKLFQYSYNTGIYPTMWKISQ